MRVLLCGCEKWSLATTVAAKLSNLCVDDTESADPGARYYNDVAAGDLLEVYANDEETLPTGDTHRCLTTMLEDRGIHRPAHASMTSKE